MNIDKLTPRQITSYAMLKMHSVNYLQRDIFDWLDFFRAHKN